MEELLCQTKTSLPAGTIRVVIADDHAIFREGLELILNVYNQLELVGSASNGKELIHVASKENPDIVISDIKMPEMDGIEATRILKRCFPEVGIIALSMFEDNWLLQDILNAGANGLLLKNTSQTELLEAIISVKNNQTYISSALLPKLQKTGSAPTGNLPAQKPLFSRQEIDIIRLVCQELSNKEIADCLNLSSRTVESYREKIQIKTGAKNAIGIVLYAIKQGIFSI